MPFDIRMFSVADEGAAPFLPPGTSPNHLPVFTWDQGGAQLTRDGASWSFTPGAPVTVTYAFRVTGVPNPGLGVTGFQHFNPIQIAVAEEALQLWAEVANITFVRVGSGTSGSGAFSNNATILFGNFVNGGAAFSAFAYLPEPGATAPTDFEGDIWVNISRDYDADPASFPQGARILAHEIGHAIGLSHPSEYDGGAQGGATYLNDADFWQDSAMFTNMSYFSETFTGGSYGVMAFAPQMLDIAAAQRLYGANMTTRTGDTVYGFNSNSGHDVFSIASQGQAATFCIWDAGGVDTIDLSGYATASEIDLREESFSSAGPGPLGVARYNISIARGAVIENAIGGAGADTLIGNAVANVLTAGGGDDVLTGAAGADTLNGGAGNDTASYADSGAGVTVNLHANTGAGGDAAGDVLSSIENIIGSAFADTFVSSAGANFFNGGAGSDTVSYTHSAAGVIIDLGSGASWDGAVNDILTSIESAIGSAYGDLFISTSAANTFIGGGGRDAISYASATQGVIVHMEAGLTWDGVVNDVISGIENTIGGLGNDQLWGDAGDNLIDGGAGGADVLAGFGGFDTVSYANSATGVIIDMGSSLTWDGVVNDQLHAFHGAIGSAHNDDFRGTGGVDVLDGGAGQDLYLGNDDADTFVFRAGQANGDTVIDFAGQGAVTGDSFVFVGYGAGATFTQIDATHWLISSADGLIQDTITLANSASVHASDYTFADSYIVGGG